MRLQKLLAIFWCAIAKISDSRDGVGGGSGLADSIKELMTIAKRNCSCKGPTKKVKQENWF
jgi:hypothetical protein